MKINNIILADNYSVLKNMIEYEDNYYIYYYNIITNKCYINKVNNFDNYPIINNENLDIIQDKELFEKLKVMFNV